MALTLYARENEWSTNALKAVARYSGVWLNVVSTFDENTVKPLSPGGSVPALATEQGGLFQVNAIARYIAKQGTSGHPLYGETEFEGALIDGWLDWAKSKVEEPSKILVPEATLLSTDYWVMKRAVELLTDDLKVLNDHCAKNTWLVGRWMSIADVVTALTVKPIFTELFGAKHRKPFNNLLRWLQTVFDQPAFNSYSGDFVLLKNSPIPNTPPKRETATEVIDVVPDVTYLGEIESTLDINDWKVKYANTNPTRPEATNWFWDHYDNEGYSLWIFHYKFFTECTVQFKTNNLFGGFLQRSDAIKNFVRNCCASMCVLEKDSFFHIWGVWMIKGNDLPVPWVENVDDVNYYDWEKVDVNNETQKNLVSDFWAWESADNFGGRGEFRTGKTYGL